MSTLKVNNLEDLGADAVVTNGVLAKSAFPAGTILQVVSTTKTDTFSASLNGGFSANVTGLEATITPGSTSSKILVSYTVHGSNDNNNAGQYGLRLMRDSTAIAIGDAAGSRPRLSSVVYDTSVDPASIESISGQTLDSPNTTSSITYGLQLFNSGGTHTVWVNRSADDLDSAFGPRPVSTITVMEVAG